MITPKLFCNNGSDTPAVLENIYSPPTLDSQNKLVDSLVNSTNEIFNNEIGYYKTVILSNINQLVHNLKSIDIDFWLEKGFSRKEAEVELAKQHFIRMEQDGILKSLLGLTTIEEVLRVSKL